LNRPRALAFGLAIAVFAANFFFLRLMLAIGVGQTLIPGLLDFSPTYNRGVSFGLLAQNGTAGCHMLIALLTVIVIGVAIVAWRASTHLAAAGFGLILGGALGNLYDRALGCAVFDFLAVHLGQIPLFVCNFPDIAISMGVILLLADSLFAKQDARDSAA
jgi:signal peptidase II